MNRSVTASLLASALLLLAANGQAANWVAGTHYSVLPQAQRTSVPAGKIEVLEVFSYGCPHCRQFQPTIKKLKEVLPANVQIAYLPASWNKAENWPLFQRAFLTAQALGIADKAHAEMFEAVWKTGELGVTDNASGRLKSQSELPTIEDAARFYQRVTGVKAADFVAASKSFGVDLKIRQADAQIKAMQVPSTPTLVVNGKYRLNNDALRSNEEIIELVKFLVAKESAAAAKTPAPPAATTVK